MDSKNDLISLSRIDIFTMPSYETYGRQKDAEFAGTLVFYT
jgi:hypothetical protein